MRRRTNCYSVFVVPPVLLCLLPCAAQTENDDKGNTINKYLVDVSGGAVSASGIIGLDKTAIQQVETSQDLVAALQPLTSGDLKSGFGLAITPARTSLLPMSARKYNESDFFRFLGGVTFSFGQNTKEVSGTKYKQTGFSVDANYFINRNDDPIVIAHQAYANCRGPTEAALVKLEEDVVKGIYVGKQADLDKKRTELQTTRNTEYKTCIDKAQGDLAKTEWNAARLNISLGSGSIRASNAESHSLGKMLTINGLYPVGVNGVIQVSLRTVRDAVDPMSLAEKASFKKGSLVAARYTFGSAAKADDPLPLRALVEASNAKASSPAIFKDAFLYAVGLDYRVHKGIWLEFRVGRNRTLEPGDKKETTGLLTMNFTPSATLFESK